MKNKLTYILPLLILGCSTLKQEKKLIGKWYAAKNNGSIAELQFYKDSVMIYDVYDRKTLKWELKGDEIKTYDLEKKGPTYKYQLKSKNQGLQLELIGDQNIALPEFWKAKNAFDFFLKTIELDIDLPKSTTGLKNISQPDYLNFNIYAGFKNKELIVKTDLSANLDNLVTEVRDFKKNKREELQGFLRFNVIADKNITAPQMDSIKNLLRQTSINTVFRTYRNNEVNYRETVDWFGKNEK